MQMSCALTLCMDKDKLERHADFSFTQIKAFIHSLMQQLMHGGLASPPTYVDKPIDITLYN